MTISAGASGLILVRVAAEVLHGLTHGGEVDDAGHAGEVLHDHARRRELDLLVGLGGLVPAGDRLDVVGGDVRAVLGAEQVLQQHLQAERQESGDGTHQRFRCVAVDLPEPCTRDPVVVAGRRFLNPGPAAELQGLILEGIVAGHGYVGGKLGQDGVQPFGAGSGGWGEQHERP
jgi:hypothetical protein